MAIRYEDVEILAPVSSAESLYAAIQGGASAVYFGVGRLNMRNKSATAIDEAILPELISIAQAHSIKTYLTVNIVLYNKDLPEMQSLIDLAKEYHITAIIASDIAAIQYAHSIGVAVHVSTQANICNIEAVKFFAQFADVLVLARELNLLQVKEICEAIHKESICGPSGKLVRIELFVHGALCMAVSGKCYLSLHAQNKSANRGGCIQACRDAYEVTSRTTGSELLVDNEYILSPKDLCTVHFLDEILDTGVRVLKIEGRARGPEYVKTVTSTYVQAVNAIKAGTFNKVLTDQLEEKLRTVYNREFWNGYYLGQQLGEWSPQYGSMATTKKTYIGRCITYFERVGAADFAMQSGELAVGDSVMVVSKISGVVEWSVAEIRVDYQSVERTKKGDTCSLAIPLPIKRGDQLYKITGSELVTVE